MKKGALVFIVAIVLLAVWGVSKYNGIVSEEEKTSTAWGQVENAYQRRADLIPNLVETVKGYAAHEEKTLTEVIEARANATAVKVDPANVTEETLKQFSAAQGDLTAALSRLIAVRESYPDLKANQNFLELQAQLEGTENRITVARNDFNKAARDFNTTIRQFPGNIVAKLCGFSTKAYFQAEEGARKAPKVSFE